MHIVIYCDERSGSTFFEDQLYLRLDGMDYYDKQQLHEFFARKSGKTIDDYFNEIDNLHGSTVRIRPHQYNTWSNEDFLRVHNNADKKIVVKRKDTWDHALSKYMAMYTNFKYATTDSINDKKQLEEVFKQSKLDLKKILKIYENVLYCNWELGKIPGIDHIVYYEDFVNDIDGHITKITGKPHGTVKLFSREEKEALFTNSVEARMYVEHHCWDPNKHK